MNALLTLLSFTTLAAQPPMPMAAPETPFFPLKPGTKWTYRITPDTSKDKANPDTVVITVRGVKKFGAEDAAELETTIGGSSQATEQIVVRTDGVYRVQVNDKKVDPPLLLLRLPPKKGDWQVDSRWGMETLKGKFVAEEKDFTPEKRKDAPKDAPPEKPLKGIVVTGTEMQANNQKINLLVYYVETRGPIKMEADVAGIRVALDLIGFEAGK